MTDLDDGADNQDATLAEENAQLKKELEAIKKAQAGSDKKVGELQQLLRDQKSSDYSITTSLDYREDELKAREADILRREDELDRIESLRSVGVPETLADVISGNSPDEYIEKARKLKTILTDEIQLGVSAEIARSSPTPRSGEDSRRVPLEKITREDAEHMSDKEWNRLIGGSK